MLSYHKNSQDIVFKIYQVLRDEHIPVWLDENKDTSNLRNSLADGVENAVVVCCFMTPNYAKCENCKCELQYAQKRHKQIIPCLLSDTIAWKPSEWLERTTTGLKYVEFHDISEPGIHSRVSELIDRINEQSSVPQYSISKTADKPSYLFELIRYEYQRNSLIERIMNPDKSFPIEQSYINLAIVNAKEQQEKEKQLRGAQHVHAIMSSFEEIYGMKIAIDVKDIFETCKKQEKQVLVFGRAGIGKSTFCQYVAYQWATGSYWPQYELLALIPLRRLTANRYASNREHSLIDLVKKEVLRYDLTEKDEILLKEQFDAKKTLWILDGYDEIVQNVPPHLGRLFEQLLKTPHHILTSRPYLNTLSYDVQMEITGFTDENIKEYVHQFFNQMKDGLDDVSIKTQKLLSFLKSNSSIWGVAHIPVNLELICSLWSNQDSLEAQQLTMTTLYSTITEWLCRRYLTLHSHPIQNIRKKEIYQRCQKELSFLECLAFNAMESNTIIIRPTLLEIALDEAKVSSQENPHILNIGVLKSFKKQGIGTRIETNKDHYFVHLSFQEYFAAQYLINAFKGPQTEKAIEFIKYQKYNQRYALVFSFMAGLLSESDSKSYSNIFWNNILAEPLDLVGIRHMQLVISCIEETSGKPTLSRRDELLAWIAKCLKYSFSTEKKNIRKHLLQSLQRAQSIVCDQTIITIFTDILQSSDPDTKALVLSFISELDISNPPITLITSMTTRLSDENEQVRGNACKALGNMGEKAATNEVISKLVRALGDKSFHFIQNVCEALVKMGEKVATNEVISKLVSALGDESDSVRSNACQALREMGEKAATNEVISELVSALGDKYWCVRKNACIALGHMSEKAPTNEVISKLVSVLGDSDDYVRESACKVLVTMSEKAATNAVISKLVRALGDESGYVREFACKALEDIGEKAATDEVINKLASALGDKYWCVRKSACQALRNMGEKAATNEVISKLASALGDKYWCVRKSACQALGNMGEKAATNEVISKLVSALGDASDNVRLNACHALRKIGEKAATNEVISKLVSVLGDESDVVRESACKALGRMGEKAVVNEVISQLISALGDENAYVNKSASEVLVEMGEKLATNEVIKKLVSALEDERAYVRKFACETLGRMGEKAVTNEVIGKLVSALGDESGYVRASAYAALGHMGDKAVTNEVIGKLVSALGDESDDVRWNACQTLGKMGKKATTNEVISKLVSVLCDEIDVVRESACEALGRMGENVSTNVVIGKLVSALEDTASCVRKSAYEALGKMGEKVLTNELIDKLVSALGDESVYVRWSACTFLGKMGAKAATNEVISKLVLVLGDESDYVRKNACEVLVQMGEKAARNEVISQLIGALGDESDDVKKSACEVLGHMGEKAATNEVLSKLLVMIDSGSLRLSKDATTAVGKILSFPTVMAQLDPKIKSDLFLCKRAFDCLGDFSVDQLIEVSISTENPDSIWAVAQITLRKEAAVIVIGDKVVVYGTIEPVELVVPNSQVRKQFVEGFSEQAKRLHLYFEMP